MLGILACMDQFDSYAVGWFFLARCTSRCVLLFDKPMMLGILADMDKKDSMRFFLILVLLVTGTSRCVLFPGSQAHDAPHHGRDAPDRQLPESYRKIGLLGEYVIFFYGSLHLEVTCSSYLPEEYRVASFPGDNSRNGFSIQHSSWFNCGYLFGISLRVISWNNFTLSYVKGGLSDPVVDPRPYDCKLWSLRSCSPSLVVDIPVMAHRQIPMVLRFSSCRCPHAVHRRWWTSLWCRSGKFQLSVLTAGMRGRFLGPCTQVQGREAVSTGTWLP